VQQQQQQGMQQHGAQHAVSGEVGLSMVRALQDAVIYF
jgi:hypothetical protein